VESYYKYWGKVKKRDAGGWDYHLLPYHCLDVAAVGYYLSELLGIAEYIARKLKCEKAEIIPIITFLCVVHDIGKFSDGFQNQIPELVTKLKGVSLTTAYQEKHWSLGHRFWREYAGKIFDGDKDAILDFMDAWFAASSGHHGRPPKIAIHSYFDTNQFPVDDAVTFAQEVKGVCGISSDIGFLLLEEQLMKELSWSIAGLLVLADWIGSNTRWFPFQETKQSLHDYWNRTALPQARIAIDECGVLPVRPACVLNVRQLFNKEATPLQKFSEDVSLSSAASLFIIEEITGAGKTEAALMLAHRLISAGYADGMYFGLPTMATANAMHERVEQVYRKLFVDKSNPVLILAHSAHRQFLALENSMEESVDEDDSENAQIDAKEWLYDNRKKALLAHVGVGTIDQALLAILPTRHQSLRLLGLHRKVLIVDEVHAYDSYMNKLLCTLLKFHAAQGGSVILLSATLPVSIRKQFLEAFSSGIGLRYDHAVQLCQEYPLVTAISGTDFSETAVDSPHNLNRDVKTVLMYEFDEVLDVIKRAVAVGKNVCWVRNTVFDAQKAYETAVKEIDTEKIILFHARYTLGDRLLMEERIIKHFDEKSNAEVRTGRLVIATQVIEQSLDVDFDCMITDLAPIDLIIQRAGRLCRHARDKRGNRIFGKDKRGIPELIVFSPVLVDKPKADWYKAGFPKAANIYEHHGHLWLTARWLDRHEKFHMPQDARDMIEFVYGEERQNDIPETLQRQEDNAHIKDKTKTSMAQWEGLNIESGYMPDSNWTDDEKAPTRLGEVSTIVRLSLWRDGVLIPFFRDDWKLSEVSIRGYWIAQEAEDYRSEIEAVKARMPDKGKFCVVVVLVEKDGLFYGKARNDKGKPVIVTYDKKRGLLIQEQGEIDESD
jgi:CRISPR-associated endonuclease/helicase Cas3